LGTTETASLVQKKTDRNHAFVVAVSGISGSGKSSVIARTVELLGDAAVLQFDAYASVSTYPQNLKEWLEQGADVNAFQTPRLAEDVRRLRVGEAVSLPDHRVVAPAATLLLEEPFGRMRREMAPLIDFAAHLDVPADVLLARRLLRRLTEERELGEVLYDRLTRDLEQHLAAGRELDRRGATEIAAAADVILDGTKSVEENAQVLAREIRVRRG
jgi:uridine kinase